jgi:hypothetical protein
MEGLDASENLLEPGSRSCSPFSGGGIETRSNSGLDHTIGASDSTHRKEGYTGVLKQARPDKPQQASDKEHLRELHKLLQALQRPEKTRREAR